MQHIPYNNIILLFLIVYLQILSVTPNIYWFYKWIWRTRGSFHFWRWMLHNEMIKKTPEIFFMKGSELTLTYKQSIENTKVRKSKILGPFNRLDPVNLMGLWSPNFTWLDGSGLELTTREICLRSGRKKRLTTICCELEWAQDASEVCRCCLWYASKPGWHGLGSCRMCCSTRLCQLDYFIFSECSYCAWSALGPRSAENVPSTLEVLRSKCGFQYVPAPPARFISSFSS